MFSCRSKHEILVAEGNLRKLDDVVAFDCDTSCGWSKNEVMDAILNLVHGQHDAKRNQQTPGEFLN